MRWNCGSIPKLQRSNRKNRWIILFHTLVRMWSGIHDKFKSWPILIKGTPVNYTMHLNLSLGKQCQLVHSIIFGCVITYLRTHYFPWHEIWDDTYIDRTKYSLDMEMSVLSCNTTSHGKQQFCLPSVVLCCCRVYVKINPNTFSHRFNR